MPQTIHQKRKNAEILAEANAKRTPQERLANLDRALGVGVGAVKERARLHRWIEEAKGKTVTGSLDNSDESGKLTQEQKDAKKAATKAAKKAIKQAA